jgi:hypothetical protein
VKKLYSTGPFSEKKYCVDKNLDEIGARFEYLSQKSLV